MSPPVHPSSWRLALFVIVSLIFSASSRAAESKSSITLDWGTNAMTPSDSPDDPVPPPVRIDGRYTAEGLSDAFRTLAKHLGYRVRWIAVDQAEFPFLVYGVLEGRCDHHTLRRGLQEMPGYAYSGSSTLITRNDTTTFALNMVPPEQYPRSHAAAIRLRLMARLKALVDPRRPPPR